MCKLTSRALGTKLAFVQESVTLGVDSITSTKRRGIEIRSSLVVAIKETLNTQNHKKSCTTCNEDMFFNLTTHVCCQKH